MSSFQIRINHHNHSTNSLSDVLCFSFEARGEGRGKREEGRGKRGEGRGKRGEGRGESDNTTDNSSDNSSDTTGDNTSDISNLMT